MNRIVFIGNIGTDAGGWYIDANGKIHRIPGWNPEQMTDLSHALTGLRALSQIKSAGVAERAFGAVRELVVKQVGEHIKEGDVLVLGI
jgi:hypothetical protein